MNSERKRCIRKYHNNIVSNYLYKEVCISNYRVAFFWKVYIKKTKQQVVFTDSFEIAHPKMLVRQKSRVRLANYNFKYSRGFIFQVMILLYHSNVSCTCEHTPNCLFVRKRRLFLFVWILRIANIIQKMILNKYINISLGGF